MNTGKKGTIFGRKRVIGNPSIGFFMREDLRTSGEGSGDKEINLVSYLILSFTLLVSLAQGTMLYGDVLHL